MSEPFVYGPEERAKYGSRAQVNYTFLGKLWEKDSSLRGEVITAATDDQEDGGQTQTHLKKCLDSNELELGFDWNHVSVLVVDCETANVIRPGSLKDEFYILFLPDKPRVGDGDDYRYAQQWAEAWYHAVRETGGM